MFEIQNWAKVFDVRMNPLRILVICASDFAIEPLRILVICALDFSNQPVSDFGYLYFGFFQSIFRIKSKNLFKPLKTCPT